MTDYIITYGFVKKVCKLLFSKSLSSNNLMKKIITCSKYINKKSQQFFSKSKYKSNLYIN